ncbi:MAG TPA: hypothetical protein VFT95_18805 [Micromonosporaceae bacterium]|nr:hypothetical protein [Micromonosporaceae bacterium]
MMAGRPYLTTAHRPCSLYRIYVLDPRTNYKTITLGYVGETARMPFTRFIEHLYEQPWGDTIVGHPEVDPRRFAGKDAVLAAEKAAVEAERPLYNYEFNLNNPDRIPIPEAIRQRRQREAARGNPNWQPGGKASGADTPAVKPAAAPSRLARWWARRRWWVVGLATVWLVLFVGGIGLARRVLEGMNAVYGGAGLATAPFVLVQGEIWRRRVERWWRNLGRPKRRRRR